MLKNIFWIPVLFSLILVSLTSNAFARPEYYCRWDGVAYTYGSDCWINPDTYSLYERWMGDDFSLFLHIGAYPELVAAIKAEIIDIENETDDRVRYFRNYWLQQDIRDYCSKVEDFVDKGHVTISKVQYIQKALEKAVYEDTFLLILRRDLETAEPIVSDLETNYGYTRLRDAVEKCSRVENLNDEECLKNEIYYEWGPADLLLIEEYYWVYRIDFTRPDTRELGCP